MAFRESINTWGTIAVGVVLAIGGGSALFKHFRDADSGSSAVSSTPQSSGNLLEQALQIAVSDMASMEAFKNKGGLEFESSWRGYKVRAVQVNYGESGKLGIAELVLEKKWPGKFQLASFENLKASLESDCGSAWTQNQLQRNADMHEATSASGTTCTVHTTDDGFVRVTLTRV